MQGKSFFGSAAALRRKLRALAAIAQDGAATPPEKATAAALKRRLEQRLRATGEPAGDWTDHAFRLGRRAKGLGQAAGLSPGVDEWTGLAHRLGKAVRRGYKKWLSD